MFIDKSARSHGLKVTMAFVSREGQPAAGDKRKLAKPEPPHFWSGFLTLIAGTLSINPKFKCKCGAEFRGVNRGAEHLHALLPAVDLARQGGGALAARGLEPIDQFGVEVVLSLLLVHLLLPCLELCLPVTNYIGPHQFGTTLGRAETGRVGRYETLVHERRSVRLEPSRNIVEEQHQANSEAVKR